MINIESDYFHDFIIELVDFYRNGAIKVPHEETISIMAIREAGIKAQEHPGEWLAV